MAWQPDKGGAKTEVIRHLRIEEARQQGKVGQATGIGVPRTREDMAFSRGRASGLREALVYIDAVERSKEAGGGAVDFRSPEAILEEMS